MSPPVGRTITPLRTLMSAAVLAMIMTVWVLVTNGHPAAAANGQIFQLRADGTIWESNATPCNASGCPGWSLLDKNPATTSISAGDNSVFQMHSDHSIWRW